MTQEVDIEISPLGQALTQLETALAAYDAEPQNAFIRDAVVQRFEFTYELSIRLLRRYLRETAASEDEVDEMTFKELIRKGEMLKLLRSGVPEWSDFRQARTDTVHTYNESRAQEVASVAKDFALEARVLFANLSRRLPMTDSKTLDLPDNEKRIVLEILSKIVPGRPVYAFGSRATGKARRRSDLDLAIGGETRLTLRQRATLSDDFSESDLPIFVDVVDLATVSDSFLQRIQRHWIPLTGEQESTVLAYTAVAVAA